MIFRWWRNRRRKQLLRQPFPDSWNSWLGRNCHQYALLPPDQQQLLQDRLRLLVAEKHWEGCGGLQVTEEMQVTVSAQAALMSVGFPEFPFDRLLSILIYPTAYLAQPSRKPWGLEEVASEPRLGEAWYQGPVILSWKEVEQECITQPNGRNVVIHEFAHLLDMANREVDGVPLLPDEVSPQAWSQAFHEEFDRFLRYIQLGRVTVLDAYAGTNPAEFLAVGSEVFFCRPETLRQHSPRLYELLSQAYQQDPATWGLGR